MRMLLTTALLLLARPMAGAPPKLVKAPRIVRTCQVCDIPFKKEAEYERHLLGRKHAENMERHT